LRSSYSLNLIEINRFRADPINGPLFREKERLRSKQYVFKSYCLAHCLYACYRNREKAKAKKAAEEQLRLKKAEERRFRISLGRRVGRRRYVN
jgi:hypothetical protein